MTHSSVPRVLAGLSALCVLGASTGLPLQADSNPPAPSWVQRAYTLPGGIYYVNPALTLESSAWGNYVPPQTPRSTPTSATTQAQQTVVAAATNTETPAEAEKHAEAPARPKKVLHKKPVDDGETKTSSKTAAAAPEVVDKTPAAVVPLQQEMSLVHISLSEGFYSHYMFRGLDVGYHTAIDAKNYSSFAGTSLNVSVGDFTLGFWNMNSLDKYVPGGAAFDGSFGKITNNSYLNPLDYKSPARVRYQEYDLFANYSLHLAKDLALTAGMNFYWFNDGRFWFHNGKPVNSTVEAVGGLTWTGIPHLTQSLFYYNDFEAFKGSFLEYKASTFIPIYERGSFAIGLSPNVTLGYDFHYNGTNNGWNSIEPGLDVPVRLADGLTLNLGVHYNWDLGSKFPGANGNPTTRTDDRLWFSAALQYSFPNGSEPLLATSEKSAKSIFHPEDSVGFGDDRKWSVSVGAGVRTINANFNVSRPAAFDIMSLVNKGKNGGGSGLASDSSGANYQDGSVSKPDANGLSTFTGGQTSSPGTGLDNQTTFHSQKFSYSQTSQLNGFSSNDSDNPVYPYVTFSREVARWDRVGINIGLGYSFARSSFDSGTQLVGLQTASQTQTDNFFTYNQDPVLGGNGLVVNNSTYSNSLHTKFPNYTTASNSDLVSKYLNFNNFGTFSETTNVPDASPQKNSVSSSQEVARVAIFRASTLDTDLHSISLPIDISIDLTKRLHAKISFGPTLNILNSDLRTDTFYQQLATEGGVRTSGSTSVNAVASPSQTVVNTTNPTAPIAPPPLPSAGPGSPPGGPAVQALNRFFKDANGFIAYSVDGRYQLKPGNYVPGSITTNVDGVTTGRFIQGNPIGAGTTVGGNNPVVKVTVSNKASSSSGQVTTNLNAKAVNAVSNVNNGKGSDTGATRQLPGQTVKHTVNEFSGIQTKFGVFGQLALQLDLDRNKRWFMEAFVRYDYAPAFFITDGAASTSVDASSWGAGLGVGVRF